MRIVNDTGVGHDTKIYEDHGGQEVDVSQHVASVHLDADTHGAVTADVAVLCPRIDVVAGEVRWHGLEDVPTAALQQEIERRAPATQRTREDQRNG